MNGNAGCTLACGTKTEAVEFTVLANCSSPLLFLSQEGFCKYSFAAREVNHDSSMKTALFAAAGVGLAGLTFLLVR